VSERPPSYGDTTGEYLAARRAGLVEDASALLWVDGADAVSFLQGILSQDLTGMEPGTLARSMLLEPRGKLVSVMWLLRDEQRIGIIVDRHMAEQTAEALNRWRFRVDAEITMDGRTLVEVWGSEALTALPTADVVVGAWRDGDGVLLAAAHLGDLPRLFVAGLDSEVLVGNGARRIGSVAADTVRIEVGEPTMGRDIDDKTIPQESGLVPEAVSFTKGCYLGQELVARIDSRGHVNRRLAAVRMVDSVVPPIGATVAGVDRELGVITSVGESLELRAPIAMGLLRREAEAGAPVDLRWEGGSARGIVVELPMVAPG
jgi:folate-binding protein YgfZ